MADNSNFDLGKKVFFLYPHSVIQNELVQLIARYEYEVYLINDHDKLFALLRQEQEAILFINIDEHLSVEEWEKFILSLRENDATKAVHVGILTYNEDQELARHFLMDLMVHAGFVLLKLGLNESAKIILKTLIATEAKGRRKYVRVQLPENRSATFNIKVGDSFYSGTISDISSGGMACRFDQAPSDIQNYFFDDIQLTLKGKVIRITGKLAGTRGQDGDKIYIILFENFRSEQEKLNVTSFINQTLQARMNMRLEKL